MSSQHIKREHLSHEIYEDGMRKWLRRHGPVTKPLLGGKTSNRPTLVDAETVEVLAKLAGFKTVREFAEYYG